MSSNKLGVYYRKRDFTKTNEPVGGRLKNKMANCFVIQEHQARRHHFDLRIQVGEVLKSWAVPKGPSTDPREKRLARLQKIIHWNMPILKGRFHLVNTEEAP